MTCVNIVNRGDNVNEKTIRSENKYLNLSNINVQQGHWNPCERQLNARSVASPSFTTLNMIIKRANNSS